MQGESYGEYEEEMHCAPRDHRDGADRAPGGPAPRPAGTMSQKASKPEGLVAALASVPKSSAHAMAPDPQQPLLLQSGNR